MPKISALSWAGLFVLFPLILFGPVACQSSVSSPEVYTLTVFKVGTGAGTVASTPGGLDCGEVCAASFAAGTIVTLTATPNGHSSFETWSGSLTGTANPQSLTMDRDKTITVIFTRTAYIISGTVTAGGAGIEGVAMTGLPGNPVTDASGAYSAMVDSGSNITVSPAHYAYTFDPASKAYTDVMADITGQNYAATLITTPQRQALIAFYNATNGDGWTENSGWKTPPLYADGFAMPGTESGWHGLTVDPGTHTVTGIDLAGNNLDGTIPAEIGDLTSLINLDLHDNRLTGPIPAEIGNLPNLLVIDLSFNQLSDSIPAQLGNLAGLYKLLLNKNLLSGPIPAELSNLSNLGYLHLDNNRLSGPIPAELGRLSNLCQLILWSNELDGSIPPELGNLINLQWLVLRYNKLSGEIPAELGQLINLYALRLGDNQLSGEIPAELGNLVNLESLRLAHNQLSGEIPDTLGNLTKLWEMLINSNNLMGPIPTSLANLTALTATDFSYNALYTSEGALITFLNTKDPDWAATQTIAPTGIAAASLGNAVVVVSWLPVTYLTDPGFYRVLISEAAGGPYTLAGQTEDKAASSVQVSGLTPGRRYYFVVQTHTNSHTDNSNAVESDTSAEASAVAWLPLARRLLGPHG
jgi:Leucine-rich repeat (LRR) protein